MVLRESKGSLVRLGGGFNLEQAMKILHIMVAGMVALSAKAEAPSYTYGQRIVAAVLIGEAAGEGDAGMVAVAEVIRNRAVEHHCSPLQVVCRKRAFSCLNGKTAEQLYRQKCHSPLFPQALRIAKVLYNSPQDLPGITRGATYYDRKDAKPPWLSEVRQVAIIGQHAFYVAKSKSDSLTLAGRS
jgi:spore germination cell wall hydrolase CwlJ-like protein